MANTLFSSFTCSHPYTILPVYTFCGCPSGNSEFRCTAMGLILPMCALLPARIASCATSDNSLTLCMSHVVHACIAAGVVCSCFLVTGLAMAALNNGHGVDLGLCASSGGSEVRGKRGAGVVYFSGGGTKPPPPWNGFGGRRGGVTTSRRVRGG